VDLRLIRGFGYKIYDQYGLTTCRSLYRKAIPPRHGSQVNYWAVGWQEVTEGPPMIGVSMSNVQVSAATGRVRAIVIQTVVMLLGNPIGLGKTAPWIETSTGCVFSATRKAIGKRIAQLDHRQGAAILPRQWDQSRLGRSHGFRKIFRGGPTAGVESTDNGGWTSQN